MRKRAAFLGLLLAAGIAANAEAQDITLSAASSLTDVLREIQGNAERFVGARILLNLGASGSLREQIEEGAPVDVFFSAAIEDMDKLEQQGLLLPASRRDLLRNSLVLVGDGTARPASSSNDLRNLISSASLIAIGNPDSVLAGRYAVEAMRKYGLYDLAQKKTALGGTVREVLQFVESGSAPLGFVFLTDALSAKPAGSIVQLLQFPAQTFVTPILYPIAVIRTSRYKSLAGKLVEFLQGDVARNAFAKAGFELP